MGVRLMHKQRLYRANKKVDKKEYQEYFAYEQDALRRQSELDKLGVATDHWKLRNLFIQSDGINEACDNGGNIGIRHVYMRIHRMRKKVNDFYPTIQLSMAPTKSRKRVIVYCYPLSTYGWPGAIKAAVESSYRESVGEDDDTTLEEALAWVDRNEAVLAEKMWGMIARTDGNVAVNGEVIRTATPKYIKASLTKSGSIVMRSVLPHCRKTVTIKDYRSLFENAAYFTALQIIHRELSNPILYEEYAASIYLMLKGEWMSLLESTGVSCQSTIDKYGYDIVKWRTLVNQWCVDEYGTALI